MYKRFVLLCNKPHTPVALYRRNLGSTRPTWLVKKSIKSKLKFAAWKVFYPKQQHISGSLAKITLHSIRIMAAMLLFEAKATDLVVMGRLRYLSTAFQMYSATPPHSHRSTPGQWSPLVITHHRQCPPKLRTTSSTASQLTPLHFG